MKKREWKDASVSIYPGMHIWPDNPDVQIHRILNMDKGDKCNVSHLSFGSHTGTHMDAPLHFVKKGRSLDTVPFDAVVGLVKVYDLLKVKKTIHKKDIEKKFLKKGDRILFKTSNSTKRWKKNNFQRDFIGVAPDAAQYLADRGIRLVGVDYLSVENYGQAGNPTHKTLLNAGVWVIEGLDLSAISEGKYDMICLPIKVKGSDGAPCRVILRKRRV